MIGIKNLSVCSSTISDITPRVHRMAFDGTRYLANAQAEIYHRHQLAVVDNQPQEEIARLEALLTALSIMLEARVYQHTFH